MIRFYLFLWLCAFFAGLDALNTAFPYELLFFYSAYKMEWATSTKGRGIAPGCRHVPNAGFDAEAAAAGLSGICSFNEFVRHIVQSDTFVLYESDEIGNTIRPNDRFVADKFASMDIHVANLDLDVKFLLHPSALFPGRHGEHFTPFPELILSGLAASGRARTSALPAVKEYVETIASDMAQYVRIARDFRQVDFNLHEVEGMRRSVAFNLGGMAFKEKVILNFNGDGPLETLYDLDYHIFDAEGSVVTSAASDEQKTAFWQDLRDYGSGGPPKAHLDAIKMQSFAHDVLRQPYPAACEAPATTRKRNLPRQRRLAISSTSGLGPWI